MKFVIRNQANIANKYIRFAKWKIRSLNRKFDKLIYSDIFIKKEGTNPERYLATIRLGVPGPDIIISASADNPKKLWSVLSQKMKRQLSKLSDKKA